MREKPQRQRAAAGKGRHYKAEARRLKAAQRPSEKIENGFWLC
ncbi:hypothetical protein HMPREF9120_02730 [Neisseria sp. oral taxon 020 str. F0370]|nr:hypothetical protein HMPREF9120_02730 [Neisseria sp. oral taxon 020 str. F0370]